VVAVLDDCLSLVSTDAAEAGVRVAIAPPPRAGGSPIVVSTDVQRLSQVVLNLLSNAIRVSSRGQTVTVSVTPGERTVSIEVADRGPGIPPHLLPRLFIPYAAGPDGDSDTALGLPLSHSLTTALGGTLTVDSEVGTGTRFTATLPRRSAAWAPRGTDLPVILGSKRPPPPVGGGVSQALGVWLGAAVAAALAFSRRPPRWSRPARPPARRPRGSCRTR